MGVACSDADQRTRSDYPWSNQNQQVLVHWQKLGQFRNDHPAVGAGKQSDLGNNTYGRVWNNDKVVIKINGSGTEMVNVSEIFNDGVSVRNAYTGKTGVVLNGSVEFTAVLISHKTLKIFNLYTTYY